MTAPKIPYEVTSARTGSSFGLWLAITPESAILDYLTSAGLEPFEAEDFEAVESDASWRGNGETGYATVEAGSWSSKEIAERVMAKLREHFGEGSDLDVIGPCPCQGSYCVSIGGARNSSAALKDEVFGALLMAFAK